MARAVVTIPLFYSVHFHY